MSCLPGNPCYGTYIDPCNSPSSGGSGSGSNCCDTILYCGPALPNSGIENLNNLCLAIEKLDNAISQVQVTVTASNGLTKVGDDIRFGGILSSPTILNTNGKSLSITNLPTQSSEPDYILVVDSLGVVKKYPPTSLGKNITLEDNVGLVWTNAEETNLSTLYNTQVPDSAISILVGGATPDTAANWKQLTLVEVLDRILFPLQLPTYALPTISLSISSPSSLTVYQEIGSTITLTANGTGTKNNAGAFVSFLFSRTVNGGSLYQIGTAAPVIGTGSTLPDQFTFPDPNNPNNIYQGNISAPFTIPNPPAGGIETEVSLSVSGTYNAGLPKKTSYNQNDTRTPGNTTNTPQAGGTISTPTQSFKGTYPYYYGKILGGSQPTAGVIAGLIQANDAGVNKVLASSLGSVTVNFNSGSTQYWCWIAIPVSNTPDNTKLSWQDTNNPNNKGNFTNPTGPFLGSPYTQNVTAPGGTPLWSNISYKFYITDYETAMNSIRFDNTSIPGQP
jgi:hypothetical protein